MLTELVENTLATGRVTVAVACNTGIDIVVVDLGIDHRLDTSLKSELYLQQSVNEMWIGRLRFLPV